MAKLSQSKGSESGGPNARLKSESQRLDSSNDVGESENLTIDIGLSTLPYYNEKSAAIKETVPAPYTSDPRHSKY